MEDLWSALIEAIFVLFIIAARGAMLVWVVYMGGLFATGFIENPKPIKVATIFMPGMVLIAAFFAFWQFKGMVNPDETRLQAIHNAQVTFFVVLLPLWAGCIWEMIRLNRNDRG